MVAKKRSKLAGAAVGQMSQLGRKHDSRGGMEGSYGGSKPSAGQKLNLHTQHSSTGRSIKTGSFHPAESATATVSPRGSNTKQAAPKKQGKASSGLGKVRFSDLSGHDRKHIREHGDVSLDRKDELKAKGLAYKPKLAAPKQQGKAVKGTGAKAKQPAVPHTLQRGKKGGSFYMSAGSKKVYTKK